MKAYNQVEGSLSIMQITKLYMISKTILYYRINDCHDQILYKILKQRLML